MERRLAAILLTDMVGYSRLMGLDEEGTIARQRAHREEVFDPKISAHGGRIVKTTGDGLLVEFPSIVDAVKCGVEVQRDLAGRDTDVPKDRRLQYRIGVNLGDIVIDGDDILGDGVNVAARLEGLAKPGGICISGTVYEHLAGKTDIIFEDAGERTVKNVPRPVRVWHWQTDQAARESDDISDPPPLPDKPSIAVLPFDNMSGDPEQEFFADGIAEDVITSLSRFPSLFVIARNSSFSYKGTSPDVRDVARDLGVRYVLEGSVRRSGERIRVTGQLVEANSGKQLWADRYDRKLGDVFALQDEITVAIVTAIAPEIDEAERMLARRRPPESLDVWSRFQIGLTAAHMTTKEALEAAVAQLDEVNALDPNFAPAFAYGVLARIRLMRHFIGFDEALIRQARDKALAAIAIDPRNPDCLMAQCRVYIESEQYKLAIAKAEETLALNANSATANFLLGYSLSRSGRPEDAITHLDRAIQLSPRDIGIGGFYGVKAVALFHLGNYQESADCGQRSINSPNPRPIAYLYLMGALTRLERTGEAAAMFSELMRLKPDLTMSEMREKIEHDYSQSGAALEILFAALGDLDLPK